MKTYVEKAEEKTKKSKKNKKNDKKDSKDVKIKREFGLTENAKVLME